MAGDRNTTNEFHYESSHHHEVARDRSYAYQLIGGRSAAAWDVVGKRGHLFSIGRLGLRILNQALQGGGLDRNREEQHRHAWSQ